ncbi:hypothetical protein EIP75_00040 [Aquabacterium soli]|uniref:Uncharacterized protein n=1 Tax=Aquabacterium soli TaxID=2493092 RepID=A0A3R8T4L2_9BURK|nr:hypothetical protein [Aquabacterium soli]RRS06042.1 hypothetical protein EIP75_00040 [Aquabacterium soli]
MTQRNFFLRRWDDFTNFIDSYRAIQFKLSPKPKHEPLTTKQMKTRLQEELSRALEEYGFCLVASNSEVVTWGRAHPLVGQDGLSIHFLTKHAPEILRVDIVVGFIVPLIQESLTKVSGENLDPDGKAVVGSFFSGTRLSRAYDDPLRPKRRHPFPDSFTFRNTDFRMEEVEFLKQTIRQYALPYYARFKSLGDLRTISKSAENQAALLVWLGDSESAVSLLNEELGKPIRRYSSNMRARLECLRNSIVTGELQKLLAEN